MRMANRPLTPVTSVTRPHYLVNLGTTSVANLTSERTSGMTPHPPHRILAVAVRVRREDLGLTWVEMSRRHGPSNTTCAAIEHGRTTGRRSVQVLAALDRCLRWWPGTAARIASGELTDLDEVNALVTREPLRDEVYGRPWMLPHDQTPVGFVRWGDDEPVEAPTG